MTAWDPIADKWTKHRAPYDRNDGKTVTIDPRWGGALFSSHNRNSDNAEAHYVQVCSCWGWLIFTDYIRTRIRHNILYSPYW
jgi:hypothetical protein